MALDQLAETVRKLHEAVMTGGLGMMLGRKPTEDTKRPVEPAAPMEPIENNDADDDAPAGPQGAKPPFESMVTAAAQALLNGKDPHEAVEDLLGEGEPEDESEVIRAVEAGIALLNIEEKPPEELPPADTSAAPPEEV